MCLIHSGGLSIVQWDSILTVLLWLTFASFGTPGPRTWWRSTVFDSSFWNWDRSNIWSGISAAFICAMLLFYNFSKGWMILFKLFRQSSVAFGDWTIPIFFFGIFHHLHRLGYLLPQYYGWWLSLAGTTDYFALRTRIWYATCSGRQWGQGLKTVHYCRTTNGLRSWFFTFGSSRK